MRTSCLDYPGCFKRTLTREMVKSVKKHDGRMQSKLIALRELKH